MFMYIHIFILILKSFPFVQRITVPEILEDEWFKKDYKPPVFDENEDINLDDVEAVFNDYEVCFMIIYMNLLVLYTIDARILGPRLVAK